MKNYLILLFLAFSISANSQIKSKEEILKGLVGTYELKGISALTGANTITEYAKTNGLWKGFISMLMGNQRDGESVKITPDVLKKLNSMKIVVNPDLSIIFNCNETQIASFPLKKEGMVYEMKGSYNQDSPYELGMIKPEMKMKDGELFLYAKDNIDTEVTSMYDIAEVGADLIIIKYIIKEASFNVTLCSSEGFGTSDYTFKKRVNTK